jgi:hypothetical protein
MTDEEKQSLINGHLKYWTSATPSESDESNLTMATVGLRNRMRP